MAGDPALTARIEADFKPACRQNAERHPVIGARNGAGGEAAIAQDSGYALAWAGLADAYDRLLNLSLPRAQAYPKARAAAFRAVALDSQLAEAYAARGQIRFRHEWDWTGAGQDFRRAVALNPGYALGHLRYGLFTATQGRFPEAIREARLAAELDPLSAGVYPTAVLFLAQQCGPAVEQARKALELGPRWGISVSQTYVFRTDSRMRSRSIRPLGVSSVVVGVGGT
jgi:tetratricopeptide (TPR) repeat protein